MLSLVFILYNTEVNIGGLKRRSNRLNLKVVKKRRRRTLQKANEFHRRLVFFLFSF